MVKIAIKSEKLTPFGGIFSIMEQFILRAIKELTQENIHTRQIQVRTTISIRLTRSILYYSIVCLHQSSVEEI